MSILGDAATDLESASLPIGFFTPFPGPPSRRLRTRFPAFILRMLAGKLRHLLRPATSEPAPLEGRPAKARPSMVASALSGSFGYIEEIHKSELDSKEISEDVPPGIALDKAVRSH